MEKKYKKLTQLEHLIKRPHMYIGDIYNKTEELFVLNDDKTNMVQQTLTFNPGIVKLLDEIILNACDHAIENDEVTKIKVDINPNYISVFNNGPGIPGILHKEENVYIPELVFTHFLTSSNYNDEDTRLKSGLNGLGAKITSAFSKKFIIETQYDNIYYKQTYKKNLTIIEEPIIKQIEKPEFTKITFYPDFSKFKVDDIDEQTIKVLERRIYDIAAYTDSRIKIFLNSNKIEVKQFKDYVKLFLDEDQQKECIIQENDRWKIAICSSINEKFQDISFVNGVNTLFGGTHVNYILNKIIKLIQNKLKNIILKPSAVKEQLMLILFCKIENPEFRSQAKECLTTKITDFGSDFNFTLSAIKKINNLNCIQRLKKFIQFKMNQELSKSDGKKKKKIIGIPNLEDANFAGTKDSKKCTLFLTEGLSAKTFAVSGLSVIGRDYFGIFPLKGKLLNVRSSPSKQIIQNNEISSIKKIIGLSTNESYDTQESLSTLRYGKVCLLCDADNDGQHIQGLIINLFHFFWPELVYSNHFLISLRTPIIKVTTPNQIIPFYDEKSYQQFIENKSNFKSNFKTKYYKGLGSSTSKEAKEIFQNYKENLIQYTLTNNQDEESILLAFSKNKAQDRKKWIQKKSGKDLTLSIHKNHASLYDFFNKSFVQYSIADCKRSIPNLMDGLKPTQRKILFGFLKKNTLQEIKVDQIRGYIAEQTLYAHGESSLNDTIISMNHDFVGSNNINYFIPCGAFGSRLMGGKDAASPRYISTKLNPIVQHIIHPDDQQLLEYCTDSNITIEPKFYAPIIPMILVNGASGIGTGYCTDIPCYNPVDIIDILIDFIEFNQTNKKIKPWYKGFKGQIDKHFSQGLIKDISKYKKQIDELPIGLWTDKFKEHLEYLIEKGILSSFMNYSTENTIKFIITISKNSLNIEQSKWIEILKLKQPIKFNLTCFEHDQLKIFKSIEEIIQTFFQIRLDIYFKRYEYLISNKKKILKVLEEKARFIRMVINHEIKIFKHSKEQVTEQLKYHHFKEIESLLNIPIHSFTSDKVEEYLSQVDQEAQELKILKKYTPKDLWIQDLNTLKSQMGM